MLYQELEAQLAQLGVTLESLVTGDVIVRIPGRYYADEAARRITLHGCDV